MAVANGEELQKITPCILTRNTCLGRFVQVFFGLFTSTFLHRGPTFGFVQNSDFERMVFQSAIKNICLAYFAMKISFQIICTIEYRTKMICTIKYLTEIICTKEYPRRLYQKPNLSGKSMAGDRTRKMRHLEFILLNGTEDLSESEELKTLFDFLLGDLW